MFTIDGFLSRRECEELIALAERRGFGATGHLYPPGYRDNDRLVLDDPALADALFARLEVRGAIGLNPRLRFCRYSGGQKFTIHRDGAYRRPNGEHSRMVCQVYLNDGFDGGHTRFFQGRTDTTPTFTVRPEIGKAIVFDHALWHDGEPVPVGTKYVVRADVMFGGGATAGPPGYLWRIVRDPSGALVTSGRDGTLRSNGVVLQGPGGSIGALTVSDAVHGGTREGVIFRADFARGAVTEVARTGSAVLDLLPDLVAACADGTLVQGATRRQVHGGWAAALAHLPRHDRIVSAGHDGRVVVSERSLRPITAHQHDAPLLALAADEPRVWIGDAKGRVTQLRLEGDQLSAEWSAPMHAAAVTTLASRGALLATGGEDSVLRVCDLRRPAVPIATTLHTDFVRSVVWTDDRSCVSVGYDGVMRTTRAAPA